MESKVNIQRALSFLSFVACLLAGLSNASGFDVYTKSTFGSSTALQIEPNDKLRLLNCSIPWDGQAASDFRRANRQWNWIYGMDNVIDFEKATCSSSNPPAHAVHFADDSSDVGFVDWPSKDNERPSWHGYAGFKSASVTVIGWHDGIEGNENTVREATDILFRANPPPDGWEFGEPDCLEHLPSNFRATAQHEVGHYLGLLHPDKHNVSTMQWSLDARYCNWRKIIPHPDDANGARYLYDSGNTSYEIAVSAWQRAKGGAGDWVDNQLNTGVTQEKCPGDVVYDLKFAYVNRGNADNYAEPVFRWSPSNHISEDDPIVKRTGMYHFPAMSWPYGRYDANPLQMFRYSSEYDVPIPASANHDDTYSIGVDLVEQKNDHQYNFYGDNDTPIEPRVKIRRSSLCGS